MIELSHPVSGHRIRTDRESVEFWSAAGYREAPKKAPAKKASSSSKSKK